MSQDRYYLVTCAAIILTLWWVVITQRLQSGRLDRVEEICERRRRAVDALDSIVRNLNDPVKIQADMERSATAQEMRAANRTTMPRENTGPPAKVYRPKLRNKPPSHWNPPTEWPRQGGPIKVVENTPDTPDTPK